MPSELVIQADPERVSKNKRTDIARVRGKAHRRAFGEICDDEQSANYNAGAHSLRGKQPRDA